MGSGKIIHGPNIEAKASQVAVNSSAVKQAGHDLIESAEHVASVLSEMEKIVVASGNASAIALMSAMRQEIQKPDKNEGSVRSYLNTLTSLLPAVANLATTVLGLIAGTGTTGEGLSV